MKKRPVAALICALAAAFAPGALGLCNGCSTASCLCKTIPGDTTLYAPFIELGCSGFVQCNDGLGGSFYPCPSGLEFNYDIQSCDLPTDFICQVVCPAPTVVADPMITGFDGKT